MLIDATSLRLRLVLSVRRSIQLLSHRRSIPWLERWLCVIRNGAWTKLDDITQVFPFEWLSASDKLNVLSVLLILPLQRLFYVAKLHQTRKDSRIVLDWVPDFEHLSILSANATLQFSKSFPAFRVLLLVLLEEALEVRVERVDELRHFLEGRVAVSLYWGCCLLQFIFEVFSLEHLFLLVQTHLIQDSIGFREKVYILSALISCS